MVEQKVKFFASKHSANYKKTKRELSAYFEIGCFHLLLEFYEQAGYNLSVENLIDEKYRYLTTPNGNPSNFSYVCMTGTDGEYEIRQQVRIKSHIDNEIAFTPDIIVLFRNSEVSSIKRVDYASGKRPFYTVSSKSVVAAHECKSTNPFPELLVSFIGMFITAHEWYNETEYIRRYNLSENGKHIAPTMFIGGAASGIHLKMIEALEKAYPINIIVGIHQGTWNFDSRPINRLNFPTSSLGRIIYDDAQCPF
jgi:hypothetical protein